MKKFQLIIGIVLILAGIGMGVWAAERQFIVSSEKEVADYQISQLKAAEKADDLDEAVKFEEYFSQTMRRQKDAINARNIYAGISFVLLIAGAVTAMKSRKA